MQTPSAAHSCARRTVTAAAAVALGLGGALVTATPAVAASFVVDSLAADGAGSLRQAILDANALAGPDEITFADGLTGEIVLDGEVPITDALTITGPGRDVLTITHDESFDLFDVEILEGDLTVTDLTFEGVEGDIWGRAFDLDEVAGNVTFERVNFRGLESIASAGAVRFRDVGGQVTVRDVLAEGNIATGAGGAFAFGGDSGTVRGTILFDHVTLRDNEAGSSGGAANFDDVEAAITIVGTDVIGNESGSFGGGLRFDDADVAVSVADTLFEGNSSPSEGGGVQFEYADGVVSFTRVSFEGNSAPNGGGLYVFTSRIDESAGDSFTITDSTFEGNRAVFGGGLGWGGSNLDSSSSQGLQLTVDSSSFWGNVLVSDEDAELAGVSIGIVGVHDDERVRIINSTFDEDEGEAPALGAIAFDATGDGVLEVLHSTVVGPRSIVFFSEGDVRGAILVSHAILESTNEAEALDAIVVEVPDEKENVRGTFSFSSESTGPRFAAGPLLAGTGYTLEWSVVSTGISPGFVTTGSGNLLQQNALLGPIGDNGGLTPTMLPGTGSPAINAGDPDVAGAPGADQRGFARIVAAIDIGAVETPTPATLPATGSLVEWSSLTLAATAILLGLALLVLRRVQRLAD